MVARGEQLEFYIWDLWYAVGGVGGGGSGGGNMQEKNGDGGSLRDFIFYG